MEVINLEIAEKLNSEKSYKCYIPKRYIFSFLACFGLFSTHAMRVNLSVAVVAMVNQTAISHFSSNNSFHQEIECPNLLHDKPHERENDGYKGDQYNWDVNAQGKILGSFYYGYIITQIPGGILSEKIGTKWLIGGGVLITSVLSLLTPLAASWGTLAFIIVRFVEGLGEGATYPVINYAISTWSPKIERSTISTLVHTGILTGNIIAMPVSGWLCSTDLFGGWPSVFYLFGGLGCIWFVFWCFLMYEKPSDHPNISKEEFLLIEQNKDQGLQITKSGLPLKSIFTSVPMWAVITACFGHMFAYYILQSELPTYLSSVLHFDIKSNGLLSSLPFLVSMVTALISSIIADKLRKHNKMSITNIRKVFNTIGMFGPALCLIGVSLAGCRAELIVGLLTLSLALNGCVNSGVLVICIDMSPDYTGTIFSITNAVGNLTGFLAPMAVSYFTSKGATLKNWSYIFYIAAAVYVVSGAIFAIFSSSELQPWGLSKDFEIHKDKPEKEHSQTKNGCQLN